MVISLYIVFIYVGIDYVQNGVGFVLIYFIEGIIFGSKVNDFVYFVIILVMDYFNVYLKVLGQLSECLSNDLY